MDYVRMTEEHLYNYRMIKTSIANMQNFIDTELEPRGLSAIRYDKSVVQVGKGESMVERDAIRLAEKATEVKENIKRNKRIVKAIDRCVGQLPSRAKTIIIMKYIESKKTWPEISDEIGYSVRQCKRINCAAIHRIAIGLYGADAIDSTNGEE